ncbi:endo-1,4-beta-xylanase [Rhodoferax sp. UBA5149]|uniref:endo-1,4-beta-xylanase n=1 Tax=Rhodoferax sp. UBA5149 TaxID=1947379 RepID=UPI0025EDFF37|nr:endo-1,4-beta-xylanase [Rhodoferax sp. UBA5149]
MRTRRRDFLQWMGSACVGQTGVAGAQESHRLDEEARRSGRRFGFAVHPDYAGREPVKTLLRQHAGVITAENAMKWRSIEGILGGRDYTQADAVATLATELKALLRGHTLAWHQSTPRRLTNATTDVFRQEQGAHLHDMVLRYKGRIHTWDVLNEVIDADSGRNDGFRGSVLSTLWGGERYPALFEQARALDPQAKLAYNDYGMEQDDPWCERRRSAVLRMLEGWVKRQAPIDVMGLQAHLDLSRRFSASRLLKFFDELKALGLGIQITELDVRDSTTDGEVQTRDASVAALYREFLDACMSHSSVEMVVMWNVTDADSWINRGFAGTRRADGQPMRPTLFDTQGQPKPAFTAVASSLRNADSNFECPPIRNGSPLCSPKF